MLPIVSVGVDGSARTLRNTRFESNRYGHANCAHGSSIARFHLHNFFDFVLPPIARSNTDHLNLLRICRILCKQSMRACATNCSNSKRMALNRFLSNYLFCAIRFALADSVAPQFTRLQLKRGCIRRLYLFFAFIFCIISERLNVQLHPKPNADYWHLTPAHSPPP